MFWQVKMICVILITVLTGPCRRCGVDDAVAPDMHEISVWRRWEANSYLTLKDNYGQDGEGTQSRSYINVGSGHP